MPIYSGANKLKELYFGKQSIKEAYYGSQLIFSKPLALPTKETVPLTYSEEMVASTTGQQNTIFVVPESAFYRVKVMGAGGGRSEHSNSGGAGGLIEGIVYLYKNTKCLLWSGSSCAYQWTYGTTGYPTPDDSLGGIGATGSSEGGGGGGSATNNGRAGSSWEGGGGGAGSGFLAGIDKEVALESHTETGWTTTISSQDGWTTGDFSVDNLYVRLLAGGGGGGSSNNGDHRSGGGGGGAFGNGGTTHSTAVARTTGPGGTWGEGAAGTRYGGGSAGAGAILDFSRNQWAWNTGGGVARAAGYCQLYKIIRQSPVLTINNMQGADIYMLVNGVLTKTYKKEVLAGTTIEWSVTKEGYKGQYGIITLDSDTKLSITLEQSQVEAFDLRYIAEQVTEIIDCGNITKGIDSMLDYGNYGTTIESKDYGSYGVTEESEDYGKIFIPADITETINNGVINA